ncbi:MAG: hypothetical protein R2794_06040 [Chitinophagales bacterium]
MKELLYFQKNIQQSITSESNPATPITNAGVYLIRCKLFTKKYPLIDLTTKHRETISMNILSAENKSFIENSPSVSLYYTCFNKLLEISYFKA